MPGGTNNSNLPFGMDDVPDRVMGSRPVTRTPSNKVVNTPGGQQASPVKEVTYGVDPNNPICIPEDRLICEQPDHMAPGEAAMFVHVQNCLNVGPTPGESEYNNVPVNTLALNFQVPEGYTLYIEKIIVQLFDSDWETFAFFPQRNENIVRNLLSFEGGGIHLPTLSLDQRNTRWEVHGPDTCGVIFRNLALAQRRACASLLGWLDRQRTQNKRVPRRGMTPPEAFA